jgi:hypothetical protein
MCTTWFSLNNLKAMTEPKPHHLGRIATDVVCGTAELTLQKILESNLARGCRANCACETLSLAIDQKDISVCRSHLPDLSATERMMPLLSTVAKHLLTGCHDAAAQHTVLLLYRQ